MDIIAMGISIHPKKKPTITFRIIIDVNVPTII